MHRGKIEIESRTIYKLLEFLDWMSHEDNYTVMKSDKLEAAEFRKLLVRDIGEELKDETGDKLSLMHDPNYSLDKDGFMMKRIKKDFNAWYEEYHKTLEGRESIALFEIVSQYLKDRGYERTDD